MSTPDGHSRKSTSGGTSKPPKHRRGLGFTHKGLEQRSAYSGVYNEYAVTLDLKYIKYKPTSGVQEVTQVPTDIITICTREPLYAPHFKAVEAFRAELGLELSVPLDLEVTPDDLENETVEDTVYIRASLAERFRMFDGLEDTEIHSPPLVTGGNVAVPILEGGEIRSELEKHEASVTK